MGTVIGVVIGYVLGTRAGDKGFDELRDAWKTISTSEEVRDMVSGGLSIAGGLLRRGGGILAERLQGAENAGLRSVA